MKFSYDELMGMIKKMHAKLEKHADENGCTFSEAVLLADAEAAIATYYTEKLPMKTQRNGEAAALVH